MVESKDRQHRTLLAVNLGLAANVILTGLKTVVGIVGNSPALLADGINSASDVVYYVVVRLMVAFAHRPADENHPYGHRQLESIAALLVGSFVITTAIAIFFESVDRAYDLWTGTAQSEGAAVAALVVAVATVALKFGLAAITWRIGRETANPAVVALASDHRNDIFAAGAASLGIFVGRRGYPWVDPLAGAVVAMVIFRTGLLILRDASADLMDTVPGAELRAKVDAVLSRVPGVRQVEEVHAHRFGPYLVLNVMVGIDGHLTVAEGDGIASAVERALEEEIDFVRRVHVHYHPA